MRPRAKKKAAPAEPKKKAAPPKATDDPAAFARDLAASNVRARGGWEIDGTVRVLPTRFPGLNRASVSGSPDLVGGVLMGSTAILHGPESGGKTALATGIMSSVQAAGGVAMLFEAPGEAFDMRWATRLGLRRDRFVMLGRVDEDVEKTPPPIYYEQAILEIDSQIDRYVSARSRFPFVIVIDSLTKLVPEASETRLAKKGDARAASMGRDQAQYNSTWVKSLGPKVADHNILVLFIVHDHQEDADGHRRIKGGKGILYDATLVLDCAFAGRVFDRAADKDAHKPAAGKKHRVRVEKTKLGPQVIGNKTTCEFFISTGEGTAPLGFDRGRELVNEAMRRGLVGVEWKYDKELTLGSEFFLEGARCTLADVYDTPAVVAELERLLR